MRGRWTRGIATLPPFQAEQAFERVQQPVPASGARGFLEGNGRLVQELVEQRMAKLLELGSVVGAQVAQASERASRISGLTVAAGPRRPVRRGDWRVSRTKPVSGGPAYAGYSRRR